MLRLFLLLFAALIFLPLFVRAESSRQLDCSSVGSMHFKPKQGLTVISGQCPEELDLSKQRIPGSLDFRSVTGLKRLNLSYSIIDGLVAVTDVTLDTLDLSYSNVAGSIEVIGVQLDTLLLRGAQVGGVVYIAETRGYKDKEEYPWIPYWDQNKDTCGCARKFGQTKYRKVNADELSARSFSMHGVGADLLSVDYGKFSGLVRLSRSRIKEQASFLYLRALGLDLNSVSVSGNLMAGLSWLDGDLSLECTEIGEKLWMWLAHFGGQLNLEGTRFEGTEVKGFNLDIQRLQIGGAEGHILKLGLERANVQVLGLTHEGRKDSCLRGPLITELRTNGMKFGWLDGTLEEVFAGKFFEKGQQNDPTLYRRLADAYSVQGRTDEATTALMKQSPVLGGTLLVANSRFGVVVVALLWLIPVIFWTTMRWPAGAGIMDRVLLALDLLLPDLVALGARERYSKELEELTGYHALWISGYRLVGWLVISVVVYVIVQRAGY